MKLLEHLNIIVVILVSALCAVATHLVWNKNKVKTYHVMAIVTLLVIGFAGYLCIMQEKWEDLVTVIVLFIIGLVRLILTWSKYTTKPEIVINDPDIY